MFELVIVIAFAPTAMFATRIAFAGSAGGDGLAAGAPVITARMTSLFAPE
jgi:hypothetical protein